MTWTLYKIRQRSDGLFSTGGSTPNWSKKGKTWSGLGPLSNHLNLVGERVENRNKPRRKRSYGIINAPLPTTRTPHPYENAEIVRYTTTEDNVESVEDYLKARKIKKDEEAERAALARDKQDREKKIARLKELQDWADSEGIDF